MISQLLHRRRAERLAQMLDQGDGARGRHSRSALDDKLTAEFAIVQRLATVELRSEERPTPEFQAGLRARLLTSAAPRPVAPAQRQPATGRIYADASPGTVGSRPRPVATATGPAGRGTTANRRPVARTRRTRLAIVVGVAAGALALSGMSMASGDAVPGDPLYGMKRSAESAQLALAGSDVDRGKAYLGFARTRAREASATRTDPDRLGPVLSELDEQTTAGARLLTAAAVSHHDAGPLDPLDDFVAQQRPTLTELVEDVNQRNRPRAQQSLDLLSKVGERASELRASITCPASGRSDALGPLPAGCTGK